MDEAVAVWSKAEAIAECSVAVAVVVWTVAVGKAF